MMEFILGKTIDELKRNRLRCNIIHLIYIIVWGIVLLKLGYHVISIGDIIEEHNFSIIMKYAIILIALLYAYSIIVEVTDRHRYSLLDLYEEAPVRVLVCKCYTLNEQVFKHNLEYMALTGYEASRMSPCKRVLSKRRLTEFTDNKDFQYSLSLYSHVRTYDTLLSLAELSKENATRSSISIKVYYMVDKYGDINVLSIERTRKSRVDKGYSSKNR